MDYINKIKQIADRLDKQGLYKQADLLDKYLIKLAQMAQAAPLAPAPTEQVQPAMASPPPIPPTPIDTKKASQEKLSRTTFLMLSDLRDFYVKNLPNLKYLGEDNIKTIQVAFDQLVTMYKTLLRNTGKEYCHKTTDNYDSYLNKIQKELDRSKNMKLTPMKVKIDKFLLYNELEILVKRIENHYDGGLKELQPVLKKARAVKDAFSNVIQNISEEVAHADLIDTK